MPFVQDGEERSGPAPAGTLRLKQASILSQNPKPTK